MTEQAVLQQHISLAISFKKMVDIYIANLSLTMATALECLNQDEIDTYKMQQLMGKVCTSHSVPSDILYLTNQQLIISEFRKICCQLFSHAAFHCLNTLALMLTEYIYKLNSLPTQATMDDILEAIDESLQALNELAENSKSIIQEGFLKQIHSQILFLETNLVFTDH